MVDPDVILLQALRRKLAKMVDAGVSTALEASQFIGKYADGLLTMSSDQKKQRMLTLHTDSIL